MRFPLISKDAACGLDSLHHTALFSPFSSGSCSRSARTRLAGSYFLEQPQVLSNDVRSSSSSSSNGQVQPGAGAASRHVSLGKELLKELAGASPAGFLELRQAGNRCSTSGLRLTSAAASSFLHSSPVATVFTGSNLDKTAAAETEEDLKTDLPYAQSASVKAESDSIFIMEKAEESQKFAEQARAVSFTALTMAFMFSFVSLLAGMVDFWDFRRNQKNVEDQEQRLEQTGWPAWLRQQWDAPRPPAPQDPWEAMRQQLLPQA